MSLAPGTRIGPYEVVSMVGAGGMGEVYRARDPKLGRDVAIKVLPEAFANDPDRLARFEREARTLAAVNHPHIAGIYGFEESDGIRALVLEFVEGETLADRLVRGPIPLGESLPIARQMAAALEGAHERGIVHRDLKPANVQLTRNAIVKVLDLGLARLVETAGSARSATHDATMTAPTQTGTVLGTAAYMSPEQARGGLADRRSDVWAFGCILYEMLCGHRPFGGATTVDALAAILERDPDWSRLPASLPPALRKLLERCLRKDPNRRLQNAGDLRIELEDMLTEGADVPAYSSTGWRLTALTAIIVTTLTLLVLARTLQLSRNAGAPTASQALRASIDLPGDLSLALGGMSVLALSPDGMTLAFSALREGRSGLCIRRVDDFEVRPIPGTDGAAAPFFSPDGQWIGFFARGQMKKVALTGGAPVPVAPAPFSRGAAWLEDGTIIFTPEPDVGLSRVSAAGGAVQALTKADRAANEIAHRWPRMLPGSKAVLFTVFKGVESDSLISVLSVDTGERKPLIPGGTNPFYVPDRAQPERGQIVYARDGQLFASPFDLRRLEVTGPPRRVAAGVQQTSTGPAAFAISSDGTLVNVSGGASEQQQVLLWVDPRGGEQPLGTPPGNYKFPRLSPDNSQLLVTRLDGGNYDLWIYDLATGGWAKLTVDAAFDAAGVWSADGRRVAFRSFRGHPFNIFWKPSDGSATEQRITTAPANQTVHAWTRDGRAVIYSQLNPGALTDLWVAALDGDRTPHRLVQGLNGPVVGVPSPDDQWLAYTTAESGRPEVFVAEFDGDAVVNVDARRQISFDGGIEPSWSRNGRELFYRSTESMMTVRVESGKPLRHGKPQALFPDRYQRFGEFVNYAVAHDGRFLMLRDLNARSPEIRILKNVLGY
jgi:eukaryotic-like serine/threonine-protein kinase